MDRIELRKLLLTSVISYLDQLFDRKFGDDELQNEILDKKARLILELIMLEN